MTKTVSRRSVCIGMVSAGLCASQSQAEGVALARSISLSVGFPAGGPADLLARLIAEPLRANTGSIIVVVNRPGAGGTIAASAVAQASPDGTNLLLVSNGLAGAPAFYPNLQFDNQKSFTPIVAVAHSPVVVLVRKQSPFKTIEDLVAAARARPGRLQIGNSGGATLPALASALLKKDIGYDILEVPYRGSGPANIDLLNGTIDANFDLVSGAMGLLSSGDVRGLAVTSAKRSAALPNLPTIAETIRPGLEMTGWFGVLAPAGMDGGLAARLNAELNRILSESEFKQRLALLGIESMGGSQEEFARLIASETERWTAIIKELGISAQ
jgi:tripartite-type tricarboxylate transporter receptor subunit TctC